MAQPRRGSGVRASSRNDNDKEEDLDNNGYVQIFMKPLEEGNYSVILSWLGLSNMLLNRQQVGLAYGLGIVFCSIIMYQLVFCDLGYLFHRMCMLIVPIFSIVCSFYWLALYYRKSWSTISIYLLFCSCFAGEFFGQCFCDSTRENYVTQPFLAFMVLLSVSVASIFSTLETTHSTAVIIFISLVRFLACTSLTVMPQMLRPFLAYFSGIVGVIGAKYMETIFKPPINNLLTQDGKIPVIKRRRSSSSNAHGFNSHRAGRRTSLPALIQKTQTPTSSYESAIIGEAHGLITDMLADSSLPPHVVSGLRAVSNLLKPPENHAPMHKPKVSPLVSLTEATNYGSDSEDLPYTGERPSSLPKRLRRSLPPSLIRRMSTSTWTTTTSATGMPTLEPEPCRTRSSSFRHSRESTPGSSPVGSRSNSPSPSSPTTISLTIPKSRSFSLANAGANSTNQRRPSRERRSFQHSSNPPETLNAVSPVKAPTKSMISPLVKGEAEVIESPTTGSIIATTPITKEAQPPISKHLNITSDYESSDSPNSSDHSDNIMSTDDLSGSSPRLKSDLPMSISKPEGIPEKGEDTPSEDTTNHQQQQGHVANIQYDKNSLRQTDIKDLTNKIIAISHDPLQQHQSDTGSDQTSILGQELEVYPVSIEDIHENDLFDINRLNQWDYQIFNLADEYPDTILSMVAYRLFTETGLFETFRIPVPEFLRYFHVLEMGYREKPYHNRVHATDVLHGVYYFTTQAIPGFQQVNPDGDIFHKQGSSSESDSECEKSGTMSFRTSFTAEDSYGIMGGNFPPLELMALYTAAAMHDYDHPGRTNAFLVTTHNPLAVLYNDRSVLESHHAASAWRLFLSNPALNWLVHLDAAEFKRFRYLIIEAILATDLKRHFELLAEFNAKVNEDDATGIDWTNEADRLMVSNMVIKMADINGPAKRKDLHVQWTYRISEEFYEQGDEEAKLGLNISPYMDRTKPQLAKLQESFINHLVAPLCNAVGGAGLIPGQWIEGDSETEGSDTEKEDSSGNKDSDEEEEDEDGKVMSALDKRKKMNKIHCWLTKHLQDNHDCWVKVLKQEEADKQKEEVNERTGSIGEKDSMEPIKEEDSPPLSAHSTDGKASGTSAAQMLAVGTSTGTSTADSSVSSGSGTMGSTHSVEYSVSQEAESSLPAKDSSCQSGQSLQTAGQSRSSTQHNSIVRQSQQTGVATTSSSSSSPKSSCTKSNEQSQSDTSSLSSSSSERNSKTKSAQKVQIASSKRVC